jgi:hypothetical protein
VKTLSDPRVQEALRPYALVTHNQLPELYCNNTVDPGVDRYPDDQVDRCPEGAGGGNVRLYVCEPGGRIRRLLLGYWKPERFLEELRHFELDPPDHERLHQERTARERLILRSIRETRAVDIEEELRRIEDEIYTKGRIG